MVCGPLLKRAAAALVVIVLALALAAPVSASPRAVGDERPGVIESATVWLASLVSWLPEPVESVWSALNITADPDGTPSAPTTTTTDPTTDSGIGADPNG